MPRDVKCRGHDDACPDPGPHVGDFGEDEVSGQGGEDEANIFHCAH